MNETHYREELSGYINNEAAPELRQQIAEHVLRCEGCRGELNLVRAGAIWAGTLDQADAPPDTWRNIEAALIKPESAKSTWGFRGLVPLSAAAALLLAFAIIYLVFFNPGRSASVAGDRGPTSAPILAPAQTVPPVHETSPNPPVAVATGHPDAGPSPEISNPPKSRRIPPVKSGPVVPNSIPTASWAVETTAGRPRVGSATQPDRLAVGEVLETDADSRASIEVANIGQVDVAPNSRVRLVSTGDREHRLSLERGRLHAKINAPPRLFIVDTPSAVAVDLGCEYTLEVDQSGNTTLHVTGGFVALERDGRESIVPAGAFCLTKRGRGIGTPYFEGNTPAFESALRHFDFEGGGAASLDRILTDARLEDTLTLWHLFPRVPKADRERVLDAMIRFVSLPAGVTRQGVLAMDRRMLETWRREMETFWFD